MTTIVEGDQKAPFSMATTLRCRGGRYSFPWIIYIYIYVYIYIVLDKYIYIYIYMYIVLEKNRHRRKNFIKTIVEVYDKSEEFIIIWYFVEYSLISNIAWQDMVMFSTSDWQRSYDNCCHLSCTMLNISISREDMFLMFSLKYWPQIFDCI